MANSGTHLLVYYQIDRAHSFGRSRIFCLNPRVYQNDHEGHKGWCLILMVYSGRLVGELTVEKIQSYGRLGSDIEVIHGPSDLFGDISLHLVRLLQACVFLIAYEGYSEIDTVAWVSENFALGKNL